MRKAGSGVREDGGGGGDGGGQQPSSISPRREGKQAQGKHFSLRPPIAGVAISRVDLLTSN